MVKTVLQCSSIQCSRVSFFMLKHRCFRSRIFFFLISATLLFCNTVAARDFGTHGVIYPIEEEDPIVLIQQKLKVMEENGELKRHNIELQQKTKAAVERPKPVEGIIKATQARVFYFDPTYVVKEDLKDHQGHVFAKRGTKINPLETVSLSQNLLFFDGDDPEQKEYAQQKLSKEKEKLKLILVKGTPLALSEEWRVPIYFDQGGLLTKKLGIQHVPALVTQIGLRLRIEEACSIDPRISLGEQE